METRSTSRPPRARLDRNGRRLFAGILVYAALQLGVLLLAAGTLRWPAAWAYFGVYLLTMGTGLVWVASVNPAVLNERGGRPANIEAFDRRFQRVVPLIIFGALIIGGLDWRNGWSAVPAALQAAGFALLLAAMSLSVWVLATNAFASRVVRLQEGHTVTTAGPYRLVRHPMYSGTLLAWLATALALGSWWMLLPGLAGIALFVWRTAREDATLQAKLPGYAEYAGRTRFRLLPGVW